MKKLSYVDLILVIICVAKNGRTWYTIERALSQRGLGGLCNPAVAIKSLLSSGKITLVQQEDSVPDVYCITDSGQRHVQYLLNEYPKEWFAPTEQNPDSFC